MRLIDADLLSEEIESLKVYVTGLRASKGVLREYAEEYQKSVLKIIDEQPTIEAEPVKHGRWIRHLGNVECSECLNRYSYIGEANYCPNCGAIMGGGADNAPD